MARSQKSFALLLTCSVACMTIVACDDDEDHAGGGTAGNPAAGKGGSNSAGTGGSDSAGAGNGGTGNGGSGNGGTAGTTPSEGGEGGTPLGGAGGGDAGNAGEAGAPLGGEGGAAGSDSGEAGAAGEGGGDEGPHQEPRLRYDFDENTGTILSDASGRGLTGTLSEAAWTAQGRNGAAISLSGGVLPTQYVTVPPGVFNGAKAVTVAAWVKLTQNPMWARLFDFGNTGAGTDTRFMYVALDSNLNGQTGIRFSYFGGSEQNEAVLTTGTVLPLNVWKHLAVTMAENGEQTIYIDGFPAARKDSVAVPPSELEPLSPVSYLGKSRFDADGGFNGAMDEFVVYDRVLAATEIAELAAPKGDYTRVPFDEAQGTTSADVSDRNVDATLNGATWTAGRVGAGVQLSGDTQYVTLADPLAGCTTELSISLWVKHAEAQPWARIFDFGGTSDNFMYLAPDEGTGKLVFSIKSTTAETPLTGTKTIPVDNAWHHLAVVVSETVASVYVDGEISGNIANPVTPAALGVTNEHWLGKSRFPDPYFKGAFDELRITCRALTVDEVRNLAFK